MSARERAGALLGFAALAAYASIHWFSLVADPPLWRWALCLAVAVSAAVVMSALGAFRRHRAVLALAALVTVSTLAAALLATGAPARLIAPAGWAELRGELDVGLAGISQVELPYEGKQAWTRLGVLLAAPLTLTIAAAIAFWPTGAARLRRGVSLGLLVTLYAVAVTWESPAAELAHGFGLLVCVAAYLWLGQFSARRTLAAGAAVLVAGLVALPAAARVSTTDPAINYASWRIFGGERTTKFNWDHTYGPLDWPQRGTELFEARGTNAPLYWKTAVLGEFDGVAWSRGVGSTAVAGPDSEADDLGGVSEEVAASEDRWLEEVEISILGLESPFLVTTGITRDVEGVETERSADDGTTRVDDPGLSPGDSYSVSAYVPNPSARLLKRRDDRPYPAALSRYTALLLPHGSRPAGISDAGAPVEPLVPVSTPLRGTSWREADLLGPSPAELIANTPYARVRSLALRLTRDAPGNYQAVAAVERYLLNNYSYRQDVPKRRHPLPAFLFRDRAGYCQQFSGAMALMLRLAGIPSRVVSGFAPGSPDRDARAFVVRDTDAHSWVEVWFPDVGWVTVDPTPSAAPARTEAGLASSAAGAVSPILTGRAFAIEESGRVGRLRDIVPSGSSDDGPDSLRGVPALLALIAAITAVVLYQRRRRRLLAPEGAGAQIRELKHAASLVGARAGSGMTLLSIERQLAPLGPEAARYPAALRDNRYRRGKPRRPGPRERRALRRAIGRALGAGGRLRALRAIPPGGPRKHEG